MLGIGVDIVEIERIEAIRFLDRFAEYFLLPREIAAFQNSVDPTQFIASRFAAKEAVIKAFPSFLAPYDFEIAKIGKKPAVAFVSPAHAKKYSAKVSISHSTKYAAAYAVVSRVVPKQ